jgi:hypothetical protein
LVKCFVASGTEVHALVRDLNSNQQQILALDGACPNIEPVSQFSNKCTDSTEVVHIGYMLSTDETSGNKSKKWNNFENVFVKLANSPSKNSKFHFVCTSREGTWVHVAEAALNDYKQLREGFLVHDAYRQQDVLVVATFFCSICDTPRAAQVCSNVGPSGKKFCRLCEANKSEYWPSDALQPTLSHKRTKVGTMNLIDTINGMTNQANQKQLSTDTGLSLRYRENPYLKLDDWDPHSGTPIEVLHVLLLGIVKYAIKVSLQIF